MMKNRKWLVAAVALLACGLSAWAAFSPGLTLRMMRSDAREGDYAAIARHVDAPAVRETLQQQISTTMALSASDKAAENGVRLRGKDAKGVYEQAGRMVAEIDPVALVAGSLVAPDGSERALEVRRTAFGRFEVGRPGATGGLQYRLVGVRWKVVAIEPAGKRGAR